jgi:hypothetical protein
MIAHGALATSDRPETSTSIKSKNPKRPAVKRKAEEDWGK